MEFCEILHEYFSKIGAIRWYGAAIFQKTCDRYLNSSKSLYTKAFQAGMYPCNTYLRGTSMVPHTYLTNWF